MGVARRRLQHSGGQTRNDHRPYAPREARGIGGAGGIGRIVRADSLSFGGRTFDRPLVFAGGRGDAGDVDGILGLDVLRQFNLSTDPRTSSLWVQPFEAPPSEDRYGLSGLWLDQADIGARVAAVGWGSPAATAGLVVGDRIVGEPFLSMLRKISGSAGTKVTLTVLRSGTARPLTFTLAPFL